MASEREILIYALQHIGQFADMVSLDEDSAHAMVAKTAYPFVRDSLLERHSWNFATRTVRLSPARDPSIGGQNVYPLPNDCLRVLDVQTSGYDRFPEYQVEAHDNGLAVYTDADDVSVRYVKRETNTERFSAGFAEALTWALAAAVAGPIVKGDTGITVSQKLSQYAAQFEASAAGTDASQARERTRRTDAPWHWGPTSGETKKGKRR